MTHAKPTQNEKIFLRASAQELKNFWDVFLMFLNTETAQNLSGVKFDLLFHIAL